MKLITLNIWGGRVGAKPLLKFFQDNKDVDIFCLQEVLTGPYPNLEGKLAGGEVLDNSILMTNVFHDIQTVLKNHQGYFRPSYLDNYGLSTFVSKKIDVLSEYDTFVHKHRGYIPSSNPGYHARNAQITTIETSAGKRSVINYHGLWNGKGKTDTPARLRQSERIAKLCTQLNHEFILCGDFNLMPDTESMKLLTDAGMRNLISENKIKSTRTNLYSKPGKYADYIFTGKDILVKDFSVLPDVVSDHAPLSLVFE